MLECLVWVSWQDSQQVHFEISDIIARNYQEQSFDAIISRDTLMYIADKSTLFSKLHVSAVMFTFACACVHAYVCACTYVCIYMFICVHFILMLGMVETKQ